jgi:hypothetical protein
VAGKDASSEGDGQSEDMRKRAREEYAESIKDFIRAYGERIALVVFLDFRHLAMTRAAMGAPLEDLIGRIDLAVRQNRRIQLCVATGSRSGCWVLRTTSPESEAWAKKNAPYTSFVVETPFGWDRCYRIPGNASVKSDSISPLVGQGTVCGSGKCTIVPPYREGDKRYVFVDPVTQRPLPPGKYPDWDKVPFWAPGDPKG